jgi:hypothetical protein
MTQMNRRLTAALAAGALLVGPLTPALAHHSFAMFDPAKVVTLKGVVTEFDWSNPHVSMTVSVPQPGGAPPELWTVELTSPGNLGRVGWTRHSIKPGDHVAVDVNPLRDGKHGGGFRQVTLIDSGQVLGGALRDLEAKPPK